MKPIFIFAFSALASSILMAENFSKMTPEQRQQADQKNWGGKGFEENAKGAGDEVAAQMLAIKDAMAREMLFLKNSMRKCVQNPGEGAEPDQLLKEMQKTVAQPLFAEKRLSTKRMSATAQEATTLKGLESAYTSIDYIENKIRPELVKLLTNEIASGLLYKYNKISLAQQALGDGRMVRSLTAADRFWSEFDKTISSIENGKDKYKKTSGDIPSGSERDKFFQQILADTRLNEVITIKGTLAPDFDRNMRVLDRYMKTTNDAALDEFEKTVEAVYQANMAFDKVLVEAQGWYEKNAISITPYIREYVARLISGYSVVKTENTNFLNKCRDLIDEMKDESKPCGQLRACKGFSPNKAFYLKTGNSAKGEPGYTERAQAIAEEAKKRFSDAVRKIYERSRARIIL